MSPLTTNAMIQNPTRTNNQRAQDGMGDSGLFRFFKVCKNLLALFGSVMAPKQGDTIWSIAAAVEKEQRVTRKLPFGILFTTRSYNSILVGSPNRVCTVALAASPFTLTHRTSRSIQQQRGGASP